MNIYQNRIKELDIEIENHLKFYGYETRTNI